MVRKIDPAILPHWARVAFAARCARHVQPLFTQLWPDASPEHAENIDLAIRLAEQSAATGQKQNGLQDAVTRTLIAAGRATFPIYRHLNPESFVDEEADPPDEQSAAAVSFVAKAAENAAKAADLSPAHSAEAAFQAFGFALDAIDAADVAHIYAGIEGNFLALRSRARREKWSDETPVDLVLFEQPSSNRGSSEKWWKLW